MLRELVNTSETQRIDAAKLRTDGGTQMRAQLDDSTVFEYTQAMAAANGWGTFPAVVAYYDGTTYWLGDGFHRVQAYRDAFPGSSDGVPVEVRSGTRRDAILHAAGANASHGLRRTNADKQRAVETLLRDNEWSQWSNAEIARRCAVDEKTVRNMRSKLEATSELPKSDVRKGADGRTINTASIGKAKPASAPAPRPVSPEQRQYDMAAVSISVPQPPVVKPVGLDALPVVDSDMRFTPSGVPADLAQRGWTLKQVPGSGRYYCHNASGPRATGVFDKIADAVQAAYDMQVDLAWEAAQQPAAAAAVEEDLQTIDKMLNCATATGVLQGMADYWTTLQRLQIEWRRDPNSTGILISLRVQAPDGGWHEWKGSTLAEVIRKADVSL